MENGSDDLNDPIAEKLRDNEAITRLVRQAVAEAVEKAQKLGFLDENYRPVDPGKSNHG